MNNELHDWGEAYKALCERILSTVPDIKHVDLYYGQERVLEDDGNWNPFRCPAVLMDFNAAEVNDLGELRQELLMDITFYLVYETTADSNAGSLGQPRALAFIQLLRDLNAALHDHSGTHYGPLSRIGLRRVDGPPYCIIYAQTYRCHMLDYSATPNFDEGEVKMDPITSPAPAPVIDTTPLFQIL